MSATPPVWTKQQFHDDVALAIASFRQMRIGEPLSIWNRVFLERRKMVEHVLLALSFKEPRLVHSREIAALYREKLGDVLRYLAAPPISLDDLKILTESTLSNRALAVPHQARAVLRVLLATLDPTRFPWVKEGRRPTDQEWEAAVLATSALMASQGVATLRRKTGKNEQEQAVKDYLSSVLHLTEVAPRKIQTLHDAPEFGSFCGESEVRGEKADVVVTLFDGRLLLIECKVSNSALNSVKRVVHEAGGKAAEWTKQLGAGQVVPAATLTGVFNARNLVQAQAKGLTLFWAHRLSDMGDFINATKPVGAAPK